MQAESEEPTGDLSESRVVLGTPGYMSPEQVLGRPLDHRTDIFALGAVLYEMFTRARAFKRGSAVETMNAVLHDEPADPLTLNPGLPPMAAMIVRRCLEKNKEERFQSARDLAFGLQQLRDVTGGTKPIRVPAIALWRKLTARPWLRHCSWPLLWQGCSCGVSRTRRGSTSSRLRAPALAPRDSSPTAVASSTVEAREQGSSRGSAHRPG